MDVSYFIALYQLYTLVMKFNHLRKVFKQFLTVILFAVSVSTLYIAIFTRLQQYRTEYNPFYARVSDIPRVKVKGVNCESIINGHEPVEKYENVDFHQWHLPDRHFVNAPNHCSEFKHERYITKPINEEEADFPLAFSLVVYKNVHQVEQLLRVIYRPQNYYCIHVDVKAENVTLTAIKKIASCFHNVFLSSERYDVKWGEFSILQTELKCMEDLLKRGTDWKYFINLTGQEFPLKTMLEIVQILKALNGTNAIDIHPSNKLQEHWSTRVKYTYDGLDNIVGPKGPAPHNITYTIGPVHIAATRAFVDYVLHNKVAQDFTKWVMDTNIPDETFFATLQSNPQLGVPGAYTGDPTDLYQSFNSYIRFKQWIECGPHGLMVRGICIMGVRNLRDLTLSRHMFANKFHHEHQPVARMCMEEVIFKRTKDQLKNGKTGLDLTPYREMIYVKNHNPS